MLRRIRRQHADGIDKIVTVGLKAKPLLLEAHDKIRRPNHGVVPIAPRHCSGMRVFAEDPRFTVAEAAANASHQTDRQILLNQDRPLLDVNLDVSADVFRSDLLCPSPNNVWLKPERCHVLGQGAARVGATHLECGGCQKTKRRFRPDIRMRKPVALLGPDRHHNKIVGEPKAGPLARNDHGEPGQHARCTIEVAAHRDGIEVRADDDRARLSRRSRQLDVQVSRCVDRCLQPDFPCLGRHEVMSELLTISVGGTDTPSVSAVSLLRISNKRSASPISGSGIDLECGSRSATLPLTPARAHG